MTFQSQKILLLLPFCGYLFVSVDVCFYKKLVFMIFAFFGSCTVGTIDYIPLTLIKSDYKKLYNHNGL